jgi:CBS domain-containing protein
MSHISEIMNTEVASAKPEDRLEDIVKILTSKKISGVPVVDTDNRVIGVITDRDLLQYSEKLRIIPLVAYSAWAMPFPYYPEGIIYEKKTEEFSKTLTRDVMSKKVITINGSDSWHDAARLMRKHSVNRVPVVDADRKLIGIVTRTDLLNYLSEQDA